MSYSILRTALPVWSPREALLATGTISGALDETFSSESTLELWRPFEKAETPLAAVQASSRFTRLAWGAATPERASGVIAAGFENGEIALWDPARILADDGTDALLARHDLHKGPVRGLDFNLHSRNLFASGATNGEIYIWDLTTPNKPYSPGARSRSIDHVTSLAWNAHVSHILATGSDSGYTVVWDLKSKREVTALSYAAPAASGVGNGFGQPGWGAGGGKRGVSCVQWHPDNPTRLVTASDDDHNPVIMLWDLRNWKEPEKILAGHDKGILSLSWCDQDADLLLSSGKDGRTICWNPSSGDIVAEVTPSSNWSFDVQWCPRNPSMLSTASLDGKISIHSIQDTSSPAQIDLAASSSLAPGVDGAGLFDQAISANAANYPTKSLTQTPKWLKRPASATFGFGGKVVLVSNQAGASSVTVRTVAGEQDIVAKAVRLEQAFEGRTLAAFCEERSVEVSRGSLAPGVREGEAASWKLLGTLFGAESKGELVSLLGFSKAEIKAKVEEAIKSLKDKISSSSIGMSKTQSSGAISTGSDLENDSASVAREPLVTFADTPNDGLSASSQGEASAANRRSGSLLDGDGHGTSLGGRDSELTEPSLFGPEDPAAPGTPGTQQRAAADFYSLIGSGRPAALPDHVFQRDAIANSSVAATVGSASSVASLSLKPTTFKIYPAEENEVDRLITRALVLGDFESAVELSLSAERFADAILLAVRGGPELLVKTQKTYFERQTSSLPYLRVFQSIVTNDLSDVVQNADLSEWQEIFVVLCTFAGPDEFSSLVEQLGQRLEYQFTVARNSPSPDFAPELRRNAILCYLAAGKLEKVVGIWIQQMKEEEAAAKAKDTRNGSTVQLATSKYSAHAAALQTFVEKVTVFQQAVGYVDEDLAHSTPTDTLTPRIYKLGALYDCYVEYADLLASQGLVHVAVKYMNQTPRDFQGSEQKDEFGPALTRDRIARASGQRANTNAFPTGLKIGADPAPAAAPYVAPAQSTSTYGYQSQQQSYPSNSYSSNQSYPSIASVQQSSYAAPPAPMPQTNAYGSMPPAQQQRGYDDPYAQASTNAYPAPPSNPYQQNPSPYSSTPSYPSQPNYSNGASQYATPSPYGASQSFIPAPPAPLDGAPTLAGRAPSNNMPPPPPRAKNDVQWNDAPPPKDARKATTPAPPSKPSAITSPFPNSSAMSSPPLGYGQPGNVPPPPPSRGSSRTPLQPAPPPPRSGQGFPPPPPLPRSGMSPPPPPPGYQNQQQRFAPGPPPPPPGPPRPPQQQNQQQSQQPGMNYPPHLSSQQQQFRGAPTPPPNAPYGRAPGTTFGPPPPPPLHYGQPPPRQTAAQQQQQQPVQAHPPPGPYSPAPGAVRSTGPPLSRRNTASPAPPPPAPIRAEPPKTKYPAGDRAHIPEANRPILNILSNEIGRLKQITPPQQAKMINDIEKRINLLFDLLNCGTLSEPTQSRILDIVKAIEGRNQAAALEIHLGMITQGSSSEVASFQAALKLIIQRMGA